MDIDLDTIPPWLPLLTSVSSASQRVVELLLSRNSDPQSNTIVNVASDDETALIRSRARPQTQPRDISSVISEAGSIFAHRVQMNHPHFFGFIPSPASPISFLGDILTSAANTHAGSWLQSSGPSAVEGSMIRFLADMAGLPDTAGGLFVSGGSMANLTALTLARDHKLGPTWQERARGVAYVSDQTHFSIAKGLRMLGFENTQIRKVQSDSLFQMDLVALENAILLDLEEGLVPFLIVASCGTTNTGSIDPLHAITKLARAQNPPLWVHVDGAYGASVALSQSHRHLVNGLGVVDSISWDAHKWLFQTYGCGMVLVRERLWLPQSFATGAEYTRDAADSGHDDSPNYWNHGPELTRPARAMKLWFTLQVLGLDALGAMIDHGFTLAEIAGKELGKLPDWTIISKANLAIVNFRFEPKGKTEEELDELNVLISKELIKENVAAILTTRLLGKTVLRICAINPYMEEKAMCHIVEALDSTSRKFI